MSFISGSEVLFILATIFWCQAMPTRMLVIYAGSVVFIAAVKVFFWR